MGDISCKHICFNIDFWAFFIVFKECFFHGVGNDGESKNSFFHIIDRQAYPVNRDGAFWDNEGDEFFLNFYENIVRISVVFNLFNNPDSIDMPLNHMPLKSLTHHHGGLYVHLVFVVFYG